MNLIIKHAKIKCLHLLRQPSYVVSTLIFPSLFFLFFAAPNAKTPEAANLLMGSFAAFAVLGVVFFQFALDFSIERATPWFQFVKTLSIPSWQFFLARSLTALFFALLAASAVLGVVLLTTPATLSWQRFFPFLFALFIGALPFCLLGLIVGYFAPSSSALPISNLVYLILSFAGGLWIPPAGLAPTIQKISVWLPTRFYGEWVWSAALGRQTEMKFLAGLLIYSAFAAPIVWTGHRRSLQ
ncbi:MAG: putative transporter, permease protein [Pseudomonadota bacterium]|jgi:ABC-2 type transport system permease protein